MRRRQPLANKIRRVLVDDLRPLSRQYCRSFPKMEAGTKRRALPDGQKPILIDHQNTDLPSR
jgi:hypothetical protein